MPMAALRGGDRPCEVGSRLGIGIAWSLERNSRMCGCQSLAYVCATVVKDVVETWR